MSLLYQIIKRCKYSLPKMSLSSSFTNPRFKTIMVHIAKKRCMSMFIRKKNDIQHIWHLLILLKNLREEIYIRYWPENLKTTNTTYLVFDYWYLRVVFASFFLNSWAKTKTLLYCIDTKSKNFLNIFICNSVILKKILLVPS